MGPIKRAGDAVTLELSGALQPLSRRPPAELPQPRLAILWRRARHSDRAGTLLGTPNEASTALRQGISTAPPSERLRSLSCESSGGREPRVRGRVGSSNIVPSPDQSVGIRCGSFKPGSQAGQWAQPSGTHDARQ